MKKKKRFVLVPALKQIEKVNKGKQQMYLPLTEQSAWPPAPKLKETKWKWAFISLYSVQESQFKISNRSFPWGSVVY